MNLRNISDFTDNEYKQQAQHKNFSMIANILSGVNFSSNKVLYTLYNENINTFQKTETVANITALKTDYHGGSSNLNGVIFNNIKTYVGGNNITIIDKKGDMGSRLDPTCAAPRYNFVKKGKLFDIMFKKEDTDIIPRYEFEGSYIEYKFMLFILPVLLINGNEGIGNGHAQKILPRNIFDIIAYIKSYLKGTKSNIKLALYFDGFIGNVEMRDESNKWMISGVVNRLGKFKTEILEVPINETYKSMIKKLDILIDKKVIRSYDDLCDPRNDKFYFIIKHDNFEEYSDDEILDKFKLIYNVSENYTVINEENKLVVFDDVFSLINHYINIRLEYYQKRKDFRLNQMQEQLTVLKSKRKFIEDIITEIIIINKRSKADIEQQLINNEYSKIDDSYNYLLNMSLYNLTLEKIEEISNKIKDLEDEYSYYLNKDIKDIWLEEIAELEKELKKQYKPANKPKAIVKSKTPKDSKKEEKVDALISNTMKPKEKKDKPTFNINDLF